MDIREATQKALHVCGWNSKENLSPDQLYVLNVLIKNYMEEIQNEKTDNTRGNKETA